MVLWVSLPSPVGFAHHRGLLRWDGTLSLPFLSFPGRLAQIGPD